MKAERRRKTHISSPSSFINLLLVALPTADPPPDAPSSPGGEYAPPAPPYAGLGASPLCTSTGGKTLCIG